MRSSIGGMIHIKIRKNQKSEPLYQMHDKFEKHQPP